MANFSAAFGYDFYIVPLLSTAVDVSTAQSSAPADFVDTTAPITGAVPVIYTGGSTPSLSISGSAYTLDGTGAGIRLAGLTTASLETDTSSEDIYTYDDETKGFNQAVATTKSFSISLAGVADFKDSGYQVLRLIEQNTVADSLRVKFLRVGPTGVTESVFGYGTLTGYSESNEVASIVSWDCTITGYGAYGLDLVTNAQLNGGSTGGGIATLYNFTNVTAFDEVSSSDIPVTLSGNATGTATTFGNGEVFGITIVDGGSGYEVGDVVTITEDGGAGEATGVVESIS